MTFRRRERPLSPEELREKIYKDYADSWLHSEALFGFEPNGGLFSLSPAFDKDIYVIFLLDAGDYITDRVYEYLLQLRLRYPRLPWMPAIVFGYRYQFLKNTIN